MRRIQLCLLAALMAAGPAAAQSAGFETSPLTGPALENAVAFTRLLGYVEYFHPSDQAFAANWEAFTVYGIAQAEAAQTPADLANTLQTLFAPLAPTVLVFPTRPGSPGITVSVR